MTLTTKVPVKGAPKALGCLPTGPKHDTPAIVASFLPIDSLLALSKTDTQSRAFAHRAFEELRQIAVKPESDDCSRLLTGCWNLVRNSTENPRPPLLAITRVAIKQGVIVLQTPNDDRRGLRYLHPSLLKSFETDLCVTSRTGKICAAKDLMKMAFAFPAHLNIEIPLPVFLHQISIHDCYADKVIILEEGTYYRIARVINFLNSPQDIRPKPSPADTFSAHFQLIERQAPVYIQREAAHKKFLKATQELIEQLKKEPKKAMELVSNWLKKHCIDPWKELKMLPPNFGYGAESQLTEFCELAQNAAIAGVSNEENASLELLIEALQKHIKLPVDKLFLHPLSDEQREEQLTTKIMTRTQLEHQMKKAIKNAEKDVPEFLKQLYSQKSQQKKCIDLCSHSNFESLVKDALFRGIVTNVLHGQATETQLPFSMGSKIITHTQPPKK